MKIKNLETKTDIFLAPMAGYTDVAFREQCKKYGAGLTTTEMVSAKGLLYDSEKTKRLLITSQFEDIKSVQIFGHEPDVIAKTCSNELLKDFDIIDINMGCPATKIVKNGDGSKLMTNFALAEQIVKSAVMATDKPVTVKMRLGYDKNVAVEFAKMLEKAGASAIAVHGRLATQGYAGDVDYKSIAEVKKAVSIPVVANGNIVDEKSYQEVLKITNADAVMIGRAAVGDPYIFARLLKMPVKVDRLKTIKEQFDLLLKYYTEHFVVTTMRKQLVKYLKDENVPAGTRLELLRLENAKDVLAKLEEILK